MGPHDGWSINSPVEDQEEEETPLLQKQAKHLTGLFVKAVNVNVIILIFQCKEYFYGLWFNLGIDIILVE